MKELLNPEGVAALRSFSVEHCDYTDKETANLFGRFADNADPDDGLRCLVGLNHSWAWFTWPKNDNGSTTISTNQERPINSGDTLYLLPVEFQPPIVSVLLDLDKQWTKNEFRAGLAGSSSIIGTDGNKYRKTRPIQNKSELEPNETLIPEGWNHEHCELCLKRLSIGSTFFEYVDDGWKHFLCEFCHKRFAIPHVIDSVIYPGRGEREGEPD